MKIVHIMNWYIPEMGYQENFLPNEQKKLGCDIQIITSNLIPTVTNSGSEIIKFKKVDPGIYFDKEVVIHRLPVLINIGKGKGIILNGLFKKIIQIKPDIIHCHGALNLMSPQLVFTKKVFNYKLFIDDHSNFDNIYLNNLKKGYIYFLRYFYKIFDKNINCWIPVTYAAKDFLINFLKINEKKIELIPLGVNNDLFYKNSTHKINIRSDLKIADEDILLIYAGKIQEDKDIDVLIRASSLVYHKYSNIKLLLIGKSSGHYLEYLQKIITEEKLNNIVFFQNFLKNVELPDYYNAADIGIWPGTCSITVIESIGTGLPVILPDHDLSYGILFEHYVALGFKRKSISSLAKAICLLIENEELRKRISDNCIRTTQDHLSWSIIAKKTIRLYTK